MKLHQFNALLGLTLAEITGNVDDEIMTFRTVDGRTFELYHDQSCCESVAIQDITGDLSDLIGEPLLRADEECSEDELPGGNPEGTCSDSYTWTFYKLATRKGYVDIRWLGESNGYYSECVNLYETT